MSNLAEVIKQKEQKIEVLQKELETLRAAMQICSQQEHGEESKSGTEATKLAAGAESGVVPLRTSQGVRQFP